MKRLLKVTALSGLLTLLKMLMGFVIAKVIAIYTGPTGMAMLGQVQSIINGFNGVVNAPAGNGVVRFTAEKHNDGFDNCSPWWRAALQCIIVLCGILIPTGFLLSDALSQWLFESKEFKWVIQLTVILLPLSALGTLFNSVINGLQNYRRFVGLGVLSVLISSTIMIIMIIQGGIKGAFFAAILQSSLIGIVMLAANFRQPWFAIKYWWGASDTKARKDIINYIFMAVTVALMAPVSLIMVRNIIISEVGWNQAGQWQAVWKISEVYLSVITIALSTYFLPSLSSLVGSSAIIKEINKTAIVIIPIVIGMAFAVYLSRDVIIYLLFTDEFSESRDLFLIQLCGDVVKIASWLYAYPMLSRGAVKWFIPAEIFFSFSFVLLTYFLVPVFSTQGANIAYLINYICYLLFVSVNVKQFSK